jgi:hypothetical protein
MKHPKHSVGKTQIFSMLMQVGALGLNGKDVEANGCGLIEGTILAYAWSD